MQFLIGWFAGVVAVIAGTAQARICALFPRMVLLFPKFYCPLVDWGGNLGFMTSGKIDVLNGACCHDGLFVQGCGSDSQGNEDSGIQPLECRCNRSSRLVKLISATTSTSDESSIGWCNR